MLQFLMSYMRYEILENLLELIKKNQFCSSLGIRMQK